MSVYKVNIPMSSYHKLCRFYLSPFFLERIYTSLMIVSKILLPSVTALGTFSSSVTVSNINSQSDSSAVIGLGVRMVILLFLVLTLGALTVISPLEQANACTINYI